MKTSFSVRKFNMPRWPFSDWQVPQLRLVQLFEALEPCPQAIRPVGDHAWLMDVVGDHEPYEPYSMGVLAMVQTNINKRIWTFGSGDVSEMCFQQCHTMGRWQFNMFNDCTALRQQSDCRALRGEERRCFSHLGLAKTHFVAQKSQCRFGICIQELLCQVFPLPQKTDTFLNFLHFLLQMKVK